MGRAAWSLGTAMYGSPPAATGTLSRINAVTDAPSKAIALGGSPTGVAIGFGSVWVSDAAYAGVLRLAPRTGQLTQQINVGTGPTAIAIGFGSIWVANSLDGTVMRINPETNHVTAAIHVGNTPNALAVGAGGMWVSNEYDDDVVGAAACLAHPAHCDLARGIVVDDAAATVTFHLTAPNPEFLDQLAVWGAAAVPASAPNHDVGSQGLPGTGPYKVGAVTARDVTLVRNPYFHEWSHAAQPAGYPDRIIWRTGASPEEATTEVEQNLADYTYDPPPQNRFNEIETRYTNQLYLNPNDMTYGLAFNVRRPPFTDLRVRQAINYAVDRERVANLFGQDSQPTCELIPPFVLGYAHYCPYTLNPGSGVCSAPDLATAQRLVAASGTRGEPITIWTQPIIGINFAPAGRYLAALLRQLGYRARLRVFAASDPHMFPDIIDSRTAPDAFMTLAVGGYAMPSQYIGGVSCQSFVPDSASNANQIEFCDPRFDALYNRAFAAEGSNPPAAASLWAQADRRLTDQAPAVPLVNPDTTDFVSRRVGDYQYNAVLGVLIDQPWVS